MTSFLRKQSKMQKLVPMMSKPEIELFKLYIEGARNYLEYGCGGSTYLVSMNPNIQFIASVEGQETWINKCLDIKPINNLLKNNMIAFHYIDYNAGTDCGKPINNEKMGNYKSYSDVVSLYPVGKFDIVLVDGRFRVACTLKLYNYIDSKARVLVHDYMNRPEYKCIEEFFDIIDYSDTMAVFVKNSVINYDDLEEYIDYYNNISD